MKHAHFQSIYRTNLEVLEEQRDHLSLYPHTEQLPLLLRALNLEFYGALPGRIARVDHRADDFHKIVLRRAVSMFCFGINPAREDRLILYGLLNPDRVAKVSIVQQITQTTRRGVSHRFRFYAGENFFPEIHLSGKRVVFSDHVLQRFSSRVPNNMGNDLFILLLSFFGTPLISLPAGPGRAFVIPWEDSILALTYKETDDEFFITTCLTMNELHSLDIDGIPHAYNFHYGQTFALPKIRNWFPALSVLEFYKRWDRKSPLAAPPKMDGQLKWSFLANWVKDYLLEQGHGPGSRICFLDGIPGPNAIELRPGQIEPQYDEMAILKKAVPEVNWETLAAERDVSFVQSPPTISSYPKKAEKLAV